MTDTIQRIPLAEIDETQLIRDRTVLDAEAQAELRHSLLSSGLRSPIEVYALGTPKPPHRYGLISGFRRLAAFRELRDYLGEASDFATIPAFVRTPQDRVAAVVAMVEENEIRADISPWERGALVVRAVDDGLFETIEAAVDGLYPAADRNKRTRLRAFARLVVELSGALADPHTLSARQVLRLEAACRAGFTDVFRAALRGRPRDPGSQWQALLPLLTEAETPRPDTAAPARPGRPRRTLTPSQRHALHIWREPTGDGWCLHFTGRNATSALLDAVFDEIEAMFAPAPARDVRGAP